MSRAIGLFAFRMKTAAEERTAIVQISDPGLESERVVHIVRIEWANVAAPGVSQNRIECLGWERLDEAPPGLRPVPSRSGYPLMMLL